MDITQFARTTIRSTLSAVLGGAGGLFDGDGPVQHASLVLDDDADLPGNTELLTASAQLQALVRINDTADFTTVCIKIPDAYGPGRDQDFLLASSADGIPFHHAVLPAERLDSRLYSSLWLYLAGFEPVVFGLRADGAGFRFLVASAVGRFRAVGTLTISGAADGATATFEGRNAGGGLRALPPALFYRG